MRPLSKPRKPFSPSPEVALETACSVAGGCPPLHRAARRISSAIIGLLLVSLVLCGAYLVWSFSL